MFCNIATADILWSHWLLICSKVLWKEICISPCERLKPAGRAVTHNSPLCYFVCWQYKKCRNLLLAVNVRILFRQVEGLCMIPTCHFHSKKGSQIYIIMINKRTAFPTILFFLVCQILHSKYILFESNKYSNENINTE